MSPKTLTSRSLEEEVYDSILKSIVTGEFQPGDSLVEARLSEQFGISKTPIREALIRLKRDGLVESAPHHKNRVTTPTVANVQEACEVREWIECQVAARCAEAADKALLEKLKASIDTAAAALKAADEATYLEAIREFSDLLVDAHGNRYAKRILDTMNNQLAFIANISRGTAGRRRRSIDEHRAIYRAIVAGDAEAAAEATARHLHSIEKDSLQRLADGGHR